MRYLNLGHDKTSGLQTSHITLAAIVKIFFFFLILCKFIGLLFKFKMFVPSQQTFGRKYWNMLGYIDTPDIRMSYQDDQNIWQRDLVFIPIVIRCFMKSHA